MDMLMIWGLALIAVGLPAMAERIQLAFREKRERRHKRIMARVLGF